MFVTFFAEYRRITIVVIVLVVLAALGAAVAWQQYFRSPSQLPGGKLGGQATPPPSTGSTGSPRASSSGGAPSPAAPVYAGAPVQALDPSVDILKQVPADTYDRSRKELVELAVSLAANPRDASGWMRVAYIKRFYGDYAGTRDAYEYLNVIAEDDALPFYNLAGLYGYYLKEPARAISKYEAALQRDSMNPAYYGGFADFHREVTKDLPAAERVLEQGMAKVSSDMNLMVSYAALSEIMGKAARAIEYYEKVLARADLAAPQRAAITAEANRLKAKSP